jgi:hypothetical protein
VNRLITATFLGLTAIGVCIAEKETQSEWVGPIKQAESKLRQKMGGRNGPQEIYALLTEGMWGGLGQRFLFVFDDRAVLHCEDGNGRTRERDLTKNELANLRRWLSTNKVDELPEFDEGAADGIQYEYFHVQQDGHDHRVFMNNPPTAPIGVGAVFFGGKPAPNRKLYGELTQRMLKLDQAPMRVIYQSLEKVPGFRVVHAKENGEVTTLANDNGQLFAGVSVSVDKPIQWHAVNKSGLSDKSEPGAADPFQADIPGYYNWHNDDLMISEGPLAGKRLWAGRRKKDDLEALWISSESGEPELLAGGVFAQVVICRGGEWIIAAKTPPGKMWDVPNGVVRIHLPDKKIFNVDLPLADNFDPIAWIDARKCVLLYRQRDREDWKAGPEKAEFYLLDSAAGNTRKVDGEVRPFLDARRHELQPTGKPHEFWAALHSSIVDPRLHTTTIGRFDSYNFRFAPALTFRDVEFDSGHFFVDQGSKIIWVNVNGDLLRLSLPE